MKVTCLIVKNGSNAYRWSSEKVKLPVCLIRRYGLKNWSVENEDTTLPVPNPVRVRGDFVCQQVYTGISKLYLPLIQCIISFVWNLEQTEIISLHRIFWSVFITKKESVCRKVKS
jgi:hypothetical protein